MNEPACLGSMGLCPQGSMGVFTESWIMKNVFHFQMDHLAEMLSYSLLLIFNILRGSPVDEE